MLKIGVPKSVDRDERLTWRGEQFGIRRLAHRGDENGAVCERCRASATHRRLAKNGLAWPSAKTGAVTRRAERLSFDRLLPLKAVTSRAVRSDKDASRTIFAFDGSAGEELQRLAAPPAAGTYCAIIGSIFFVREQREDLWQVLREGLAVLPVERGDAVEAAAATAEPRAEEDVGEHARSWRAGPSRP